MSQAPIFAFFLLPIGIALCGWAIALISNPPVFIKAWRRRPESEAGRLLDKRHA